MLLIPKSIGILASRGALIPVGTMQAFRNGRVPALEKWRDAAENINLEIAHGSHMTERYEHFTREQRKAAAENWPFDRPKIVPNGVDATMVAG